MSAAVADNIDSLLKQLKANDRGALARLLTLAANGVERDTILASVRGIAATHSPVVAFTGAGGVGKSSLLGAVTAHFAARGEMIGVLACDPESPVTGGSLLGDRCRIAGTTSSERIFIRSLPTAAGQQSLAPNVDLMLALMEYLTPF